MNIIINTKKRIKNTFPGTNYNFFVIGTKNYFTINSFSSLKTFAKIDDIFKIELKNILRTRKWIISKKQSMN